MDKSIDTFFEQDKNMHAHIHLDPALIQSSTKGIEDVIKVLGLANWTFDSIKTGN